jgi:polysaccharide export outer membrane protein
MKVFSKFSEHYLAGPVIIMSRKIRGHPSKAKASLTRGMILLGVLVMGCGGPARQVQPAQLMAKLQAQNQKHTLQDQLLAQAGQATLASYRDYTVGPEDLLQVTFLGVDDLSREVRVNGQGEISLPLVGDVKVGDLSTGQIEKRLKELYRQEEYLKDPQITVKVLEYRNQRVMVTGSVVRPGSYEMIGPRTLLEMLGKAGGLKDDAGEMVYIIRAQTASDLSKALKGGPSSPSFTGGSETIVIDLRRLLAQGGKDLNLPIKNGDIIQVPRAQSAFVLGAVLKPGNVMVKDNLTAIQAVAVAGGQNPILASDHVTIVRMDETGKAITIPLNLGKVTKGEEADIPLKANDIVYVKENPIRRVLFDFRNLMPGSYGLGTSIAP